LGALQAAAVANSFTYDVSDKNYGASGALLLDNVRDYDYVKGGSKWYAYVNDVYKDGYNNAAGALNLIQLVDGDKVEFYYANIDSSDLNAVKAAATAAVKTVAATGVAPTDWTLQLSGAKDESVTKAYFEQGLACPSSGHQVFWTDDKGTPDISDDDVWGGVPLWLLVAMVDDNPDVGGKHINFNEALAEEGYQVKVVADDGTTVTLDSTAIAKNNSYIIANTLNGQALPLEIGSEKGWPLYLIGSAVSGEKQVGNIVRIELSGLPEPDPVIPELHIVKYGDDGTTVIEEETLTYIDMQSLFDVIGDGTTVYKYEGITNNADDIWDAAETYPGGFKIANAVKGTLVKDLVERVGGMGTGTDIVFKAKDDWETTLPYSSIYTDPSVQARQGDAILAWYADGKYVPEYQDGMRLFFTPDDQIYGQWDMHETLPEAYWHYYYDSYNKVMYPSCAGLSPKYITEIKVYSTPAEGWTLNLDGQGIGGLVKDISKTYFESALTCTMGANHKATYIDSQNRTWAGMPLWFLAGFVDDTDQHSDNAFNNDLANAGYQVIITAEDGYSVTIESQDIIRNNDYIVANTLDGFNISEADDNWPLKLVGPKVSGSNSIGNIVSIELVSSSSLLTPPALTADTDENKVGQAIEITFTGDAAWENAIYSILVNGLNVADTRYTVSSGKIAIAENVFTEAKDYTVDIKATGYEDASVVQTINSDKAVYSVAPVTDSAYTIGETAAGIKTMTVNAGISGFSYFAVDIEPVSSHSGLETAVFTHLRNGSQLQINSTRADFDQVGTAQAGFNVKAGDIIRVYIVDSLTNAVDHNPVIFQ
jgi:DMSO/TMAO reductase YedYZ molybdopterin-dependent catalytic subunit